MTTKSKSKPKAETHAADSPFAQYAATIENAVALTIAFNMHLATAKTENKLTDQERAAATVAGLLGYLATFTAHTKLKEHSTRQSIDTALDLFFQINGDKVDAIARRQHN